MEPAGFSIKKAAFATSAGPGQPYPESGGACEIAIVGKSNVGKSSLINRLCGNAKLARTSATPGKTRLINFFTLTGSDGTVFSLVDLPGYGYAKASKSEQKSWGDLIEKYLSSGRIRHLFLLLDIRHSPTALDKQMYAYILYYGIPFTLIATKADKLARSKRPQSATACAKELGAPGAVILPFSAETGEGKEALLARIESIVLDGREKA